MTCMNSFYEETQVFKYENYFRATDSKSLSLCVIPIVFQRPTNCSEYFEEKVLPEIRPSHRI